MGGARTKRDQKDVACLSAWFRERNPFSGKDASLRCLSTGKTAVDGDGINCDTCEDVGALIQVSMDGVVFTDVKFKKKAQVRTLERLRKGVVCDSKVVYLHSTHLFNRLIVLVERTSDMASYFAYELTPQPASLFKESCMRKPDKASLGKLLRTDAISTGYDCRPQHVLDGGCLLYKVKWPKVGKYCDVVKMYINYVKFNFGCDSVIVFDGYSSSTKDHEHVRRSTKAGKVSADVTVAANMCVHSSQSEFLANVNNKCHFIALLSSSFQENGFQVHQSRDDADTLIAKVGLTLAVFNKATTVVASDTDVLVLLVHHWKPSMGDVYVLMQPTTGKLKGEFIVNVKKVQENIGSLAVKHLLVLHAFGGCDTTSALYSNGKVSIFKKVLACAEAESSLEVMNNCEASREEVGAAGRRLLLIIYGGKCNGSLHEMRHSLYMKMCSSSSGRPLPERLPPTENAAFFHSLRVHLQVLQWSMLSSDVLDPSSWGWKRSESGLYEPIAMEQEPAPAELLKVIRCSCKTDSRNQCGGNACTCRRNGLACVSACGKCRGIDCLNNQPALLEEVVDGAGSEDECEEGEGLCLQVDAECLVIDEDLDWLNEEIV
jgi:hypothetical protein